MKQIKDIYTEELLDEFRKDAAEALLENRFCKLFFDNPEYAKLFLNYDSPTSSEDEFFNSHLNYPFISPNDDNCLSGYFAVSDAVEILVKTFNREFLLLESLSRFENTVKSIRSMKIDRSLKDIQTYPAIVSYETLSVQLNVKAEDIATVNDLDQAIGMIRNNWDCSAITNEEQQQQSIDNLPNIFSRISHAERK